MGTILNTISIDWSRGFEDGSTFIGSLFRGGTSDVVRLSNSESRILFQEKDIPLIVSLMHKLQRRITVLLLL